MPNPPWHSKKENKVNASSIFTFGKSKQSIHNEPEETVMVKLEKEVSPVYEVQHKVQPIFGLQTNTQVTIMCAELCAHYSEIWKQNQCHASVDCFSIK